MKVRQGFSAKIGRMLRGVRGGSIGRAGVEGTWISTLALTTEKRRCITPHLIRPSRSMRSNAILSCRREVNGPGIELFRDSYGNCGDRWLCESARQRVLDAASSLLPFNEASLTNSHPGGEALKIDSIRDSAYDPFRLLLKPYEHKES